MKKLLFLAATVMVAVLAIAPVGFAGEDDPGPSQAGELVAPPPPAPAAPAPSPESAPAPQRTESSSRSLSSTKSKSPSKSTSRSKSHSKGRTLAAHQTIRRDTVKAKGGVQTGFGGVVAESASSNLVLSLGLGAGGFVLLAAAAGLAPIRRRSEG